MDLGFYNNYLRLTHAAATITTAAKIRISSWLGWIFTTTASGVLTATLKSLGNPLNIINVLPLLANLDRDHALVYFVNHFV